ncbi:MAG: hypothetical protein ACYDBS_05640, partial [Acidimicrobiales bacterium]
SSIYWANGGVNWAAIVAQVLGMFAALSALYATFHLPPWLNEITVHTSGADFSVFMGLGVGGIVYLVLARGLVRKQAAVQDQMFATAEAGSSSI